MRRARGQKDVADLCTRWPLWQWNVPTAGQSGRPCIFRSPDRPCCGGSRSSIHGPHLRCTCKNANFHI